MKKILARTLLQYSTDQLWDMLTGRFIIVFDNGDEVETNARLVCYSSYAWDFIRQYPLTPFRKEHHVQHTLRGRRLGSGTHLEILGAVMWAVHDTYAPMPDLGIPVIELRDRLSEMIYRLTNQMYNDLTYRAEEYVVSLDITDFMNVLSHPRVRKANDEVQPTQTSIDATQKEITSVLQNAPEMATNPVALAVRSKMVNLNQVLQCVGPRGFITDTDSNVFRHPVRRGYAQGIRRFHDSLIESRSAAKALIFSKSPLQQAEYFARRLQLMSQTVRHLHAGDCGTNEYLHWIVRGSAAKTSAGSSRASDLKHLNGKYYMDETDGELRMIRPTDRHLIGKLLKIRSAMHCAHPDPYGICTTCFGELSLSVPADTNIGHMCCTSMTQKSSQNVLSVKHLDGSSVVDPIILTEDDRQFLKVGIDDASYLLSDSLKGAEVTLVIPAHSAINLTDVMEAKNPKDLHETRISELEVLGMRVKRHDRVEGVELFVNIGRRMASMTHALLMHVREHGWETDEAGNYLIKTDKWDWNEPILTLPMKHVNMSDHSKDIASLLESNMDELQQRDQMVSPDTMLVDFFDLVNDRLDVNLAVLEVILYGAMIVSAERMDYSLPKPGTDRGLGVMSMSMAMRSLSAAMAYQDHRDIIVSPLSYTQTNRTDHPMDIIICPTQVVSYGME